MIDSIVIRTQHLALGEIGWTPKKILVTQKWLFDKGRLVVNAHELPFRPETTGGEDPDFKRFEVRFDADLPKAKTLLADGGYESDHIRNVVIQCGGTPVIPGNANRNVPIKVDAIAYALRYQVER